MAISCTRQQLWMKGIKRGRSHHREKWHQNEGCNRSPPSLSHSKEVALGNLLRSPVPVSHLSPELDSLQYLVGLASENMPCVVLPVVKKKLCLFLVLWSGFLCFLLLLLLFYLIAPFPLSFFLFSPSLFPIPLSSLLSSTVYTIS